MFDSAAGPTWAGGGVLRLGENMNRIETLEARRLLVAGGTFDGTLAGDEVDSYAFAVAAGEVVTFDLDGRGDDALADGRLRLLGPGGDVLATNDDSSESPGDQPDSMPYIEVRVIAAGTVTVEVAGAGTGDYALRVANGDLNDQASEAAVVGLGPTVGAAIAYPADVDVYRFVAPQTARYGFDVDTTVVFGDPTSGLDSILLLADANATDLAFNDDRPAPGEPAGQFGESYLEFDLTAGAAYFLAIARFGNAAFNLTTGTGDNPNGDGVYDLGDYTLTITGPGGTAPAVVSSVFTPNGSQTVAFAFDAAIDPASVSPGDLTLLNTTTGQTIPSGRLTAAVSPGGAGVRFDYDVASFGPLPDGNYVATLAAGTVSGVDGTPTDADATLGFFFLNGDFNRDRGVNLGDFTILANNFGRAGRVFAQGDANYDGVVNLADFTVLANRFGATLPPPGGGGGSLFDDGDGRTGGGAAGTGQ